MSLRTSLQKLIRRDPAASLRERAATTAARVEAFKPAAAPIAPICAEQVAHAGLTGDVLAASGIDHRDGGEPATAEARAKTDAMLLALAPEWEAARDAYAEAIQRQIVVSNAADSIEPRPSQGIPFEERQILVQGWRERTGVEDAEAASAAALDVRVEIEDRISELSAASLAGLRLKARVAQQHDDDGVEWPEGFGEGLTRDLLAFAAEPEVDWHAPPPGFMAYPTDDPQGFVIVREGLRLELERLHQVALAEYARKVGPDATEATQARVRQELRLDIFDPAPTRGAEPATSPPLDALSAQILALWPVWAAHTGDDGTDEQTAAYDAMQQRRFALLDAADALPATSDNIQAKALALAWLHYVNEWRRGQKRSAYCIDERLAVDIHMAALAQGQPQKIVAYRPEPSLVGMTDFASATMEELRALHDVADLVGGVAYAVTWQGRCKARGGGDRVNAAGKLMQWLGDALTSVETAANEEVARRTPSNGHDRERRLAMRAAVTIDNGDSDQIEALARELLAHVEAEREGR